MTEFKTYKINFDNSTMDFKVFARKFFKSKYNTKIYNDNFALITVINLFIENELLLNISQKELNQIELYIQTYYKDYINHKKDNEYAKYKS